MTSPEQHPPRQPPEPGSGALADGTVPSGVAESHPDGETAPDQVDTGPQGGPAQARLAREDRRRLAKVLLLVVVFVALVLGFHTWHGRSLDVTLVHRFPSGDTLLPASVQVMVWQGESLYADAYFPNPTSLGELEHLVRVPRGRYEVTFSLFRVYGQNLLRFERELVVEQEGRYFLTYETDREFPR